LALPRARCRVLAVAFLQQLHFVRVRLHDELRFGSLLLDFPALSEVHTADHAQHEQTDRGDTNSDPAPEPIHEVFPS
jgi:hypothetical protein